jgi:hypothetical protein
MVQRHALKVGKEGGDMKRELLADGEIRRYYLAQGDRSDLGRAAPSDQRRFYLSRVSLNFALES